MERKHNKQLRVLLSLTIIVSIVLGSLITSYRTVDALTTNDIKTKMYTLGNSNSTYKNGSHSNPSWTSCWQFVNVISKQIYGFGIPSQANDSNYVCPEGLADQKGNTSTYNSARTVLDSSNNKWEMVGNTLGNYYQDDRKPTADNLRALFMYAQPGDIVQMDYTKRGKKDGDNSIHILMIYDVSSEGVVFYHAYYDSDNDNGVIRFGNGNTGDNPLYSNSIGGRISYSTLATYFTREDDGLSIYHAKNVELSHDDGSVSNRITVSNDIEFLEAVRTANNSDVKKTILLTANITVTKEVAESYTDLYISDSRMNMTIWEIRNGELSSSFHSYSPGKLLKISNCDIIGFQKLNLQTSVYLAEDSSVKLGIETDCRLNFDPSGTNYWFSAGYLCNDGYVWNLHGDLYNRLNGYVSYCNVHESRNDGHINWLYNTYFSQNCGYLENLITGYYPVYNYGTIDVAWTSRALQNETSFPIGDDNRATITNICGTIKDSTRIPTINMVLSGGTIENGSYTTANDYSVTFDYSYNPNTGVVNYTEEQSSAISMLSLVASQRIQIRYADGTARTTFYFKTSNLPIVDFMMDIVTSIAVNSFSGFTFNIYKDITLNDSISGVHNIQMNGRNILFSSTDESFSLPEHMELHNGTVTINKPIRVESPNTFILDDVSITVADDLNGEGFICDNGRLVFDNCDSATNEPIQINVTTQSDIVEIYDDDARTVQYMDAESTDAINSDFVIRYNSNTNGVTSYTNYDSWNRTENVIYSSLVNAMISNGEGQYSLHSDAMVNDLIIPEYLTLNVSEDNTITVENSAINDGTISGSGNIVVNTEEDFVNNGNISDDVSVEWTPTPSITPSVTPSVNPTTIPTVVPTTRPTAVPTTVPTTVPTATPTPTPEIGVGGFVERLYTIALGRPSDPRGKADWVNRVYTDGVSGADIAQGFLFSPEFLGKDMTNDEFLGVLYRVFFDREGDSGGINYWLEQMSNGMDKQNVIWGFINSTEWANVCLRFGISSGGNGVANITVEPSDDIISFATRLYTTCLGRPADQAGLMDWATRLANRQISGSQAAAGFFTSAEFVNANYGNAEYINRLYQTFMGRPADQGGFDYWMGQFANGATREDVFNGFAGSQEWAGICASYGILK